MPSISEIHAKIQADFRKMQTEHEISEKNFTEYMYAQFPRVEEIDREISTLAITNAKKVIQEKISPEEAASLIREEAEILRAEKRKIMSDNGYTQYTPTYFCKNCNDTGYSNGKKCGCYMKKLRDMLALPGEKGESAVLKNCSFDKFDLSYYPNETDPAIGIAPQNLMKAVYANCVKFASDFSGESSGNLLLCGPSGLGKTFLAASIANKVTDKGYLVIYKSAYKLFQFLEEYKFGKIDRDTYSVVYDSIYDCDLLVIDDFGTEFITSYTQSVLFDLLSTRLSTEKSTIISTNLSFAKISDIYQERVMSRLQNEFTVLRFAGNDIRAIKNNK